MPATTFEITNPEFHKMIRETWDKLMRGELNSQQEEDEPEEDDDAYPDR